MSEYRDRSHSPRRSSRRHGHQHSHAHRHHSTRSRSPDRSNPSSGHRSRHGYDDRRSSRQPPKPLPLNAASLSKHDLLTHRPLFALYLDVQKQLDIEDLEEDEVKGRWKSFVKKWNTGDLAEGWYDDQTFQKAKHGTFGHTEQQSRGVDADNGARGGDRYTAHHSGRNRGGTVGRDETEDDEEEEVEEEDDDFGPNLPASVVDHPSQKQRHGMTTTTKSTPGPSVPSTSDLRARDEQSLEDAAAARANQAADQRAARKAERILAGARLDELVPRAEGGTRERQLEKKREVAEANRAFAAAKDVGGGEVELGDADIMGGDGDGHGDSLLELKRLKEMAERKKTEREVRRDEILRARMAEREERMKGLREKEAKTMDMLKSIARARFGGDQDD